jgi:hypothetical protein
MPKTLYRSFAGGEITPELHGRLDLPKFQTGLRECTNFFVLAHGPAVRRPGFRFKIESGNSNYKVRLIPFTFAADQSVMLEFGHQYVRFHTKDGVVLEAAQAIVSIVGSTVVVTGHGYSNGEDVFIGSRFHRITVVDANTFTTADLWGNATTAAGTTAARVYTLPSPYSESNLPSITFAQDSDVLTLTSTIPTRELRRSGPTSWAFSTVSFTPTLAAPTGVTATATVAVATNLTAQKYQVTSVAADGVTESLPSSVATCNNNLTLAGNFNTVTGTNATGATRYYIYKLRGGIFGFIGQCTDMTVGVIDDNILADTTVSPPGSNITLNAAIGDYPAAVTYFERRRWFAGTANAPQNIWATRNGTQSNLTSSIPSRDDDGLVFKIAAQQQNAIRHLVPLADLLALTVGGEFRIFADGGPAISPSTLSIKPQGFSGAAIVQPVLTTGSAIYIQAQGSRVKELAYDPSGTGFYRSTDLTILATHLVNGYSVTSLTYVKSPESQVWAVRDQTAGLLCMTYVPEQQVFGWSKHTTARDGVFEEVASMPEGSEDSLWVVVRRVVNGRPVRYIERMESRASLSQNDLFYVDCGLTYSGAPTSTVTGLYHLEGEPVVALADGAVVASQTVVNGSISLPSPASVVHVGLAYNSDLVTLPLAFEAPAGGQGIPKNVNRIFLRVVNSSLVKAGPTFDKLRSYPARQTTDPYGSPPALRTFEAEIGLDATWGTDGSVCVRQDAPLPLVVAAMALETSTGG